MKRVTQRSTPQSNQGYLDQLDSASCEIRGEQGTRLDEDDAPRAAYNGGERERVVEGKGYRVRDERRI